MKKLNKKGFTLIELLAVIVILAILVAVSVPAVTKYLGTARKGTYADNAQVAISAVRNDVISQFGASDNRTYYLNQHGCYKANGEAIPGSYDVDTEEKCERPSTICGGTVDSPVVCGTWIPSINDLLEKKLKTSPYGKPYDDHSYVKVTFNSTDGSYKYFVCITDGTNGIKENEENVSDIVVGSLATCEETPVAP